MRVRAMGGRELHRLLAAQPRADQISLVAAETQQQQHFVNEEQAKQDAAAVARLQREYRRLRDRIDGMYVDKLDGKVDAGLYERKAAEWRAEQAGIMRQVEEHEKAKPGPITDVRSLAKRLAELFAGQPAHEKRKLLDYIITGCVWKDGELAVEWREWSKMALFEKGAA